ncbi:MAG: hypothetical protein JW787_04340 [Sedimentisphaerales bacterium]|nr:hypothetical protein [Sedimentisphaerales bacterium]
MKKGDRKSQVFKRMDTRPFDFAQGRLFAGMSRSLFKRLIKVVYIKSPPIYSKLIGGL